MLTFNFTLNKAIYIKVRWTIKSYCKIHDLNRDKERDRDKRNALNYWLEFLEDQLQFNSLPIQFYSTLSIQSSREGSTDMFSIVAE